jgi:diguanylate cyclase with GGDEF domain
VICAVSKLLVDVFGKATGQIARIGGEEFAVFIPDLDGLEGTLVADAARRKICSLSVRTRSGPVPVAISVGVAEARPGAPPRKCTNPATVRSILRRRQGETPSCMKARSRNCGCGRPLPAPRWWRANRPSPRLVRAGSGLAYCWAASSRGARLCARLEGRPRVRAFGPSFETLASQAPQDEVSIPSRTAKPPPFCCGFPRATRRSA